MATLKEEIVRWLGDVVPEEAKSVLLHGLCRTHFPPEKVGRVKRLGLLEERGDRSYIRFPLGAEASTWEKEIQGAGYAPDATHIYVKVAGTGWMAYIPLSGGETRTMVRLGDVRPVRCPCAVLVDGELCAVIEEFLSRNSCFL